MKIMDNIWEFFDARNTVKELNAELETAKRINRAIQDNNNSITSLCGSLESRLEVSGKFLDESKEALDAANKELKDLKKLVREQTEADLLLVSKQIERRILEGEKVKKEDPMIHQQNFLLERMNEMERRTNPGLLGQALWTAQDPFNR